MLWLWYVAPVALVVVYFLSGLPGSHERRRDRALARWRDQMTPKQTVKKLEGYRGAKEKQVELAGPRPVSALPGELHRLLPDLGGGQAIARYELLEKLAYVVVMGPDAMSGSEYQAVLARLAKPATSFRVRPLPIVEGKRLPNTGVQFKKDPEFMRLFLVEGDNAKAIGKWLPRALRDVLRESPDVWLVVDGRAMAVVHYGPVDADRLHDLIGTADAIFAERGAEGGPSLFFDDEKEDEDEDEDEDEEEEEREAAEEKPAG